MVMNVGQTRILAVDDNPEILHTVETFMRGLGHQVDTATNAPEALGLIRTGDAPDILVTDIVMPGAIDGIELAKIVTQSHPKMGILLMTGWSYDDAHGFPVLTKPFELDELDHWIINFLKR